MTSRRLILAAVLVFLAGWGTLMILAVQGAQKQTPPSDAEPERPHEAEPSRPPPFSREEIAMHDRPDDCWLLIDGRVYDVTRYIASHPAPRRTITDYCGKESTGAFETKERGRPHSPQAQQLLETYFLGEAE